MANSMIEVEDLGKLYKLGSIGTGTFSHDLNSWWHKVRSKPDPNKVSASNSNRHVKANSNYVWSLKDINFEVQHGEIFGVIGGNGAGKSTLLKLLSKITKPTKGEIRLNGRVASLLEVGTGFHPELTGRENIYLNGAILGMRRLEIKNRFEDIVEFSGIGRYIDTPVKKYSSGMYVRLAFAVAAHLEPDILIVDEVLAVGDAEFQAKCMGKMKDVSTKQGRTVLFVSHNITAIRQLCNKALLLEQGEQKAIGTVRDVISIYQNDSSAANKGFRKHLPTNQAGYFTDWKLNDPEQESNHTCVSGDTCTFSFGFRAIELIKNCEVRFAIRYDELAILHVSSIDNGGGIFTIAPGVYRFTFKTDLPIKEGKFDIAAHLLSHSQDLDYWISDTRLVILDNNRSSIPSGLYSPQVEFILDRMDELVLI